MSAASTSNFDSSTDIMSFSPHDPGYNLWTSYAWGLDFGQSTKNPNPQK